MIDGSGSELPPRVARVIETAKDAGLFFGSDPRVGALLRTLAASKPGGRLLELGTGVGIGAAWLLDGMDPEARLTTIDARDGEIARRSIGDDPRVELLIMDAATFLVELGVRKFDLIFADAPPGKLVGVERALDALAPGGIYVVDDMIVDPDSDDPVRASALDDLTRALLDRRDLVVTGAPWATGVILATKR